MKKFLLKLLAFGLVGFLILNVIAFLCLYQLRKSNFYKPQFVSNGVKEKQFDYVVLGSSTGLTTLDTKQIDSITSKKGLNISMDDSQLSSHYLMLEHFYEAGKNTRQLILAVTPWDMAVLKPVLNDNDYRFLPDVNRSYIEAYYKNLETSDLKILAVSKFLPIIGVAYYNTEIFYPAIVACFKPALRNRFDDRGNYSYPVTNGPKETGIKTTVLEIKNPYFFKIKQFCLDKNIDLVVYLSPMYKNTVTAPGDMVSINHSGLIEDPAMFYDNIHVNIPGRRVCSQLTADYLIKNDLKKAGQTPGF